MSTFHQRSTHHLHKLQVLKPGPWPWRPLLPFLNDLCIQKCALCLQTVELLKFSLRTQSICHAAGSHITRGVRQLLSEGLWFSDQETPVMLVTLWGKHGAGMLITSSGSDLVTRNVWAWTSSVVSRPRLPHLKVITGASRPLVQNTCDDFII